MTPTLSRSIWTAVPGGFMAHPLGADQPALRAAIGFATERPQKAPQWSWLVTRDGNRRGGYALTRQHAEQLVAGAL